MANITYHREFSELSPVLYTSLSNHIPPESNDDSVLILWDDHHHSHYNIFEYHDAATILIMIVAWFLLILGLTLCCCSQCINGALGGLSKRISNEAVDNSNSNSNRNVCITIPECDQMLVKKLEQLALGVDITVSNISLDYKQDDEATPNNPGSLLSPQTHVTHTYIDEVEYSRVVSDIWVGVILTLLIVSVIFLICAGFLYHKFQKWKNSYRSETTEPTETCCNYSSNYEMESLPSYTIVSGLPTYDDALEQFRKAGIILSPPMPIIKIFEAKDTRKIYSIENGLNENDSMPISNSNACTCANSVAVTPSPALPSGSSNAPLIELSPEQLAQLSQKRLSLQIAFGSQVHRNSRPRINMYNQLLRSRAISNTDALEQRPQIHRSYSSSSISVANNSN